MHPSAKTFEVLPDQSLLESGLSAGVALPFGCANGSCGDCLCRIKKGQIKPVRHHDYSLTQAQKLDGYCLLCSNTATSDVQLEVIEATSVEDIPQQELQAKLCYFEQLPDVCVVAFKFVRGKALRFLPGQQIILSISDGEAITLPIASCPCNAQYVEIHLTIEQLGIDLFDKLSKNLNALKVSRKRVTVQGPVGNFTLSSATRQPKLFIARGAEFAQLQGLIEQVLNADTGTRCCLLWQATDLVTHYRSNLCRSWHDAFDEFDFVPVKAGDSALASLPIEWPNQLNQCEVYLGATNARLTEQLMNLGVNAIFYPA